MTVVAPPPTVARRLCRSRSRYGLCGRTGKHHGPYAVPIGDGVWYGYDRAGRHVSPLGYGHLHGDTFTPTYCCDRPESQP